MARKTVSVRKMVAKGNLMIANAETPEERRAFGCFVEAILFDSDNYRGFRYAPSELNSDGHLVTGYDDTKRIYTAPEA